MDTMQLAVQVRSRTGKSGSAAVRKSGAVPAVLYGGSEKPVALSIDEPTLLKLFRTSGERSMLLDLKISGNGAEATQSAIIKALQHHPVTEQVTHVDFLRVDMNRRITVEVPIVIEGSAPGLKAGGVLQQPLRSVSISSLPGRIPPAAVADVSALELGQSLTVGQLAIGDDVELVTSPEETVLSITTIRVEEETPAGTEAAPEAADAAAQPEVIGEKEREERRAKKDEDKVQREKDKQEQKEAKSKDDK